MHPFPIGGGGRPPRLSPAGAAPRSATARLSGPRRGPAEGDELAQEALCCARGSALAVIIAATAAGLAGSRGSAGACFLTAAAATRRARWLRAAEQQMAVRQSFRLKAARALDLARLFGQLGDAERAAMTLCLGHGHSHAEGSGDIGPAAGHGQIAGAARARQIAATGRGGRETHERAGIRRAADRTACAAARARPTACLPRALMSRSDDLARLHAAERRYARGLLHEVARAGRGDRWLGVVLARGDGRRTRWLAGRGADGIGDCWCCSAAAGVSRARDRRLHPDI